jgi:hypothetical protein
VIPGDRMERICMRFGITVVSQYREMACSRKHLVVLAVASALATCKGIDTKASDGHVYTLYRTSAAGSEKEGKAARIHVATFDSLDGAEYNRENCWVAQELFQNQPGVKVQYWCEKGRYRK